MSDSSTAASQLNKKLQCGSTLLSFWTDKNQRSEKTERQRVRDIDNESRAGGGGG